MTAPLNPAPRTAHVVLVAPDGECLGRLRPVTVDVPWWDYVPPVVEAVRARDRIEIIVLRLLEVDQPHPPGGNVTYLAEARQAIGISPWHGELSDHPARPSYARPRGPSADLAWANAKLEAAGIVQVQPPQQIRTWNLSSLWRLATSVGGVWLKVVPSFFAHEGRLLQRLADFSTPRVIAADGPRLLMLELPGEHVVETDVRALCAMVGELVSLQAGLVSHTPELIDLGVPDWSASTAVAAIASVIERLSATLPKEQRALLDGFVEGLPWRFAELDACGVPMTLVHGDFHPGNGLCDDGKIALFDFGDTVVGHPLLDMCPFLGRAALPVRSAVRDFWLAAWRRAKPMCEPERAAHLVEPIAIVRQSVIYQAFVDKIEPAERPYHVAQPAFWLKRTAEVLGATAEVE